MQRAIDPAETLTEDPQAAMRREYLDRIDVQICTHAGLLSQLFDLKDYLQQNPNFDIRTL